MKTVASCMRLLLVIAALFLAAPQGLHAQEDAKAGLKKDQLAQLVAPIALYPDALLSQILMASTYPLEIVQADRWVQQNRSLKGDALAKALESQTWDPSVKSLVNFPKVLAAMSEKLDQTTKLGDAFLGQQKELMEVVQELRRQAYDAGNLKTTKEQKVVVEKETIIIEPVSTQVVYVPTYSPTVVYGVWAYPAYPPYYYYPPPPPAYPAYHFAAGVAVGVAWGYAWGNCNWHGGHVEHNINQNININRNIDRSKYQNRVNPNNKGAWQHDPSHRKGVAYRDNATAQKFNRASTSDVARARDSYRGRTDQGGLGGRSGAEQTQSRQAMDQRGGAGGRDLAAGRKDSPRPAAFDGMDRGNSVRDASSRGSASRQSMSGGGFGGSSGRSGGFGGGGGRGGGGGGRGGGRR